MEYLGHVISKDGLTVCDDKIVAVKDFPTQEGPTKVKSFLGLAGFYRRFVKSFSQIAAPLYKLTQKGVQFEWSDACQAAFDMLKARLISKPVLAYPDFTRRWSST